MAKRDLLLLVGLLREGQMFPVMAALPEQESERSLRAVEEVLAEQEHVVFGGPKGPSDDGDIRRRSAVTSWSGERIKLGTRVSEVPDPGVLICLLYDGPVEGAPLPVDVFAQTLRRFALRDGALRVKFDEHVDRAGTFVPAWLSPDVRKQKSIEAFQQAMRVASQKGFAHAAPLLEGVRGEAHAKAQVALAVYELRDLGEKQRALRRLHEVVRMDPTHVPARMQRAGLLIEEPGREADAALDYLRVLRELSVRDHPEASPEVRKAAARGLWRLHGEFAEADKLAEAVRLGEEDLERGMEALSRYVQTHPCSWDAHLHLATVALRLQRFETVVRVLAHSRYLFPDDPQPHFIYGQAAARCESWGPAYTALEWAQRLSPEDPKIAKWFSYVRDRVASAQSPTLETPAVRVAHHVARNLLVVLGIHREKRLYPFARVLHALPGDVALSFVLSNVAKQEQHRFRSRGHDVGQIEDRTELTDYGGEPLGWEQTTGDVPDPGIVVAILYEGSTRDAQGQFVRSPSVEAARRWLFGMVEQDSELSSKLNRHLQSGDASLRSRLG